MATVCVTQVELTGQPDAALNLAEKIRSRTAKAGVIGLGYVGLPLSVELCDAGLDVTGIDVHPGKVESINQGRSYIQDVESPKVTAMVEAGRLRATADFSVIRELDTLNIAVPTPLRKTKDPDMTYVVAACEQVAKYAHPGLLVILESTTYPGTTDELVLPMLEASGLRVGVDIFLCFSPERVDPGNPVYQTANIPKVVGGVTPACTELGALLYEQALDRVIRVSSTKVAEMVKLLENTFRMINIGLVNEIALMCERMNVDVWEIIDARDPRIAGARRRRQPRFPQPQLALADRLRRRQPVPVRLQRLLPARADPEETRRQDLRPGDRIPAARPELIARRRR